MNKTKDICKIYNVGSDDAIEINVLLKKLSNKYKIRSNKINNFNIKKTDYYVPNTNKIKNELNWRIKNPEPPEPKSGALSS